MAYTLIDEDKLLIEESHQKTEKEQFTIDDLNSKIESKKHQIGFLETEIKELTAKKAEIIKDLNLKI